MILRAMLRVVAHKSAAAAKAYYTEGLKREDYYAEKQEVVGRWHGLAAELLGLEGKVASRDFAALAENRHPVSGEKLTPRTKLDRRVGYDLNFHAPKSLSVLYALTGDKQILEAFRAAVIETMSSIETATTTRVRQKGAQSERTTGNLVWAEFVHFTARPVGAIPDPHLHAHCFAFNSTFDPVEERWKAASWAGIKKDAPYNEAVFHSLLTNKLAGLGYGIERTRGVWEVSGVSREVIEKFSRRTAQIERLADAAGITDAKAKDALGASSREGKRRGLSQADLLAAWNVRLDADERLLISEVAAKRVGIGTGEKITPERALDEACDKLLGKQSVTENKRIVAEALRFGVGKVTPDAVWAALDRRGMITRQVGGEVLCTSLDALAEEVSLVNFVRSGRDRHAPLVAGEVRSANSRLSGEQRAAVRHLLTSPDQVMAIRGAAGVGKTTLMQEAVAQIEKTGRRVFAFAPSASASRGTLREAGFAGAETVARLLVDKQLQEKIRRQVILIDEAGLLGVRDMWRIMQLAGNSTRVILAGDIAQHAPVARGDAFRLLHQYAGMPIAEVTNIRRQEGAVYRKAVAALSRSDLATGFKRLDELGAVVEVKNEAERYRRLAEDYLASSRKDSLPLVVSPTHAEAAKVTKAIREAKREAGRLGVERPFVQLHPLQWEDADKRRLENYQAGLVVQFHQNAPGILRGERFRIVGIDHKAGIQAVNDAGREIILPLAEAQKFQVFEERQLNLARGDRLRITRNSKSDDGRRLNNGNIFTIDKFTRDGKIVLDSGARLASRHGHFALGYVSTSHSAQGKTVRDVLVAQSEASFAASSREQFYVSVSRGKSSIRIYTDSRKGLQEAVGNTSARQSGIELAGFTPEQITSFMATELGARQWRDAIHSRRAQGETKSHVQNLLAERKQEGIKKPESMDFRQYLEMRRGMAGADGKSRSKGHPSGDGDKKVATQDRGRSFLRPTQPPSTPAKERTASANENKAQAANKTGMRPDASQTRQDRFAAKISAGRAHFAKVSEKVKGTFLSGGNQKRPAHLPSPSVADAARHSVKQRAADAAKTVKIKTQAHVKAPAPVMRRGK